MSTTVRLVASGLFAFAGLSATPTFADSYFQVEAARARARAGGPVSYQDAELLERYGCLSGTQNAFCERLRDRDRRLSREYKRRRD